MSLYYLIGALRDGSIYYDKSSRNYFVIWYQKDKKWLEKLRDMLEEIGFKGIIDEYKKGHFRLRVRGKKAFDYFIEVSEFKLGSQIEWVIPEIVKKANKFEKAEFIAGVFDTEGDIGIKKNKSYIGISQKNKNFLKELREILNELGIKTGKLHLIDKKSNTWRIVIASKESMLKFTNIIPSIHDHKRHLLAELVELLGQQT